MAGGPVELHRACAKPKCNGRLAAHESSCPVCGANYGSTKFGRDDVEIADTRAADKIVRGGAVLIVTGVVIMCLEDGWTYGGALIGSGFATIAGALQTRRFLERQAARKAARKRKRKS